MTGAETVSDKLRRWADESEANDNYPSTIAVQDMNDGLCDDLQNKECDLFRWLAGEINREKGAIIEAQGGCHASPHHIIKAYAERSGMPMRDGETITQWLDRWFISRPRLEDGEPVQFGDEIEVVCDISKAKGIVLMMGTTNSSSWKFALADGDSFVTVIYDSENDKIRRPALKVLDADGMEIKVGDTVWVTTEHARDCGKGRSQLGGEAGLSGYVYGAAAAVKSIESAGKIMLAGYGECTRAWCPASWLTTQQPDTQERIDEDARKSYDDYWKCSSDCDSCPADWPLDRIGCDCCTEAMYLDLLRRQRELDAAMAGGGA